MTIGADPAAICYRCEHCGCDPSDPEDSCWVCDTCPGDLIDDDEDPA